MNPFSIIIPVYNEEEILEKNVKILINRLNTLAVPYEIVAVSNGSTDSSVKIGLNLQQQYSQVKFFSLPEKGVGRAFKRGMLESKYDHIIFMDADLSADLSFIEKSNQLLDKYVLVLGAKIKGTQNRGIIRRIGSFTFYLSVLALMGLKYVDYAPGAKAYRKDFLMKYFKHIDDYTSFVLNLTFIASLKKEPIIEISIACEDRRKSKFNLLREAGSKYHGLLSLKIKQLFKLI
jgi:glycosyltransferase involved in cell wall biosynthesis